MTIRPVIPGRIRASSSWRFSIDGTLPTKDEGIFPVMLVVDRNVPINRVGALNPILLAKESGKILQDKLGHIKLGLLRIINPPDFIASNAILAHFGLVPFHPRADSPTFQ